MINKDPAFVFYSSDFLTGVSNLTMEERGQYITLLCLQHQLGHLSKKTINLNIGQVSDDVLSKFEIDENNNYFNERLEYEINKRAKFIEHQKENGSKGGRPKKPKQNPNETQTKPKKKPLENEIEIENRNEDDIDNSKNKVHFAEFVTMTNAEYEKLVSTHGKEFANQCIETLDNYKGSKGKKYVSDYRAILSWVIDTVKEKQQLNKKTLPEWYGKDLKNEEMSKEEKDEMEELLKSFGG